MFTVEEVCGGRGRVAVLHSKVDSSALDMGKINSLFNVGGKTDSLPCATTTIAFSLWVIISRRFLAMSQTGKPQMELDPEAF